MIPGDLDVKVSAASGSGTVHLRGELDLSSAPRLREALSDLYRGGTHSLILDLSELAFVDSTGLSELVAALKHCRQRGGDVVLRSPSASTAKVLAICGLDRVFTVD